jgi:hypothetical protein
MWFEGMEWGCICAGSSKFAIVNLRKCTDEMLRRSQCYDVPEIPKQRLSNLRGYHLCVKRDPKLTYRALVQNQTTCAANQTLC